MHRICRVQTEDGYRLRLDYADEGSVIVDLELIIHRGGVFASLADPTMFGQIAISAGGRFIEWPNGVDLCADALWMQANESTEATTSERVPASH